MKIYYFITDNGDGSARVMFFKNRDDAVASLEYLESIGDYTLTDCGPDVLDTDNDTHFSQRLSVDDD